MVKEQALALHYYELSAIEKVPHQNTIRRKGRLDIFAVEKSGSSTRYRRINTVAVTDERWRENKLVYQMALMWLDSAQQTKPIILLRRSDRSGHGGSNGSDLLFTFPDGFDKKAVANVFGRAIFDAGLASYNTSYGPTDKNGYLTVLVRNHHVNDVDYTAYKWDGERLAKFAEQSDEGSDAITYDWDGETFLKTDLTKLIAPSENP